MGCVISHLGKAVSISVALLLTTNAARADDPLDTVIYTGLDVYKSGSGVYLGFVTALDGDISTNGWTVSGNLGFSKSRTSLAKTTSGGASVLLGYQWHTPTTYTTLALGADVIDTSESPNLGSPNNGTHSGLILQAGFNTKYENAPYFQAYGAYLSANKRSYAQVRGGWAGSKATFGIEAIYANESDSEPSRRLGLFVSDIPLGNGGVGFSVGLHDDLGTSGSDGGYLGLEYSIPVSLR